MRLSLLGVFSGESFGCIQRCCINQKMKGSVSSKVSISCISNPHKQLKTKNITRWYNLDSLSCSLTLDFFPLKLDTAPHPHARHRRNTWTEFEPEEEKLKGSKNDCRKSESVLTSPADPENRHEPHVAVLGFPPCRRMPVAKDDVCDLFIECFCNLFVKAGHDQCRSCNNHRAFLSMDV